MNVPAWLCIVVVLVLVALAWSVASLLALALARHRAAENTVLATRELGARERLAGAVIPPAEPRGAILGAPDASSPWRAPRSPEA